jgi:hypothetical protein
MPADESTSTRRAIARRDRGEEQATASAGGEPPTGVDERYYTHLLTILTVSSGMVGVCLTAIGLIGIIKSLNKLEMAADDLLAWGALIFMLAAVVSFFGMRTRISLVWRRFAVALDLLFCSGLIIVVVATVMLTWFVL